MAEDGGTLTDDIIAALGDDLNTHGALSVLHRAASDGDGASLKAGMQFLGLMGDMVPAWATEGRDALADLSRLLKNTRAAAMKSKDFSEVDRLKSALAAAGVEVRMSKSGVDLLPAEGFDPTKLEALK
jgi:cysteinyl-tRNA synthetase